MPRDRRAATSPQPVPTNTRPFKLDARAVLFCLLTSFVPFQPARRYEATNPTKARNEGGESGWTLSVSSSSPSIPDSLRRSTDDRIPRRKLHTIHHSLSLHAITIGRRLAPPAPTAMGLIGGLSPGGSIAVCPSVASIRLGFLLKSS